MRNKVHKRRRFLGKFFVPICRQAGFTNQVDEWHKVTCKKCLIMKKSIDSLYFGIMKHTKQI